MDRKYKGFDLYTMANTGFTPDNSFYEAEKDSWQALLNNQNDMDFRRNYIDAVLMTNEATSKANELEQQRMAVEQQNLEQEKVLNALKQAEVERQQSAQNMEAMDVSAAKRANMRRLLKGFTDRKIGQTNITASKNSLLGS